MGWRGACFVSIFWFRDFSSADRLVDGTLRGSEVEEDICACIKEET